jgi:hypothetical protein
MSQRRKYKENQGKDNQNTFLHGIPPSCVGRISCRAGIWKTEKTTAETRRSQSYAEYVEVAEKKTEKTEKTDCRRVFKPDLLCAFSASAV